MKQLTQIFENIVEHLQTENFHRLQIYLTLMPINKQVYFLKIKKNR